MKTLRLLAALTAALLCTSVTNAHDFEVNGIYYLITSAENHTVAVTFEGIDMYNPKIYYTGDVVVPERVTYNEVEYTVVSVGERAFMNSKELTSVSLPESIERIERLAFSYCYNLETVKMPSEASYVGQGAFDSCKKLESIKIPEGVETLYYTTFNSCDSIESIILPNSLTTIENGVFTSCKSLLTIVLPESLTSMGKYTFGYCDMLDSITIPSSLTNIGTEPFCSCPQLKVLRVAEGNPKYDSRDNCNAIIETENNKLVVGCAGTIIPEGITAIGTYAFCGVTIPELILPESLETIEKMGIRSCNFYKPLIVPAGVKKMEEYALCYNSVDSIIVRGQITRIENYTFDGNTRTTVIDLPESIEYIGKHAFARCSSLNKLICRASTPPACESSAFYNANLNSTLEVLEESLPLYEKANVWKDFVFKKAIGTADVVVLPDSNRHIVNKGHGTYYAAEDGTCTYLFSYDFNADIDRLDDAECTQWYRWNAIVIDVDTIGAEAFAGCTFGNGQVIYLTERVKVIDKDAFARINSKPRITADAQETDNLTLVFEGANPPCIANNKIMDFNGKCRINVVVPDLATYIASDIQWTYMNIRVADDLLDSRISAENRIYTFETTEADVVADFDKVSPSGIPTLYALVRPRKDIPVLIGTGGDYIYSPAPEWQEYTIEVQVTNDDGIAYYGGKWKCKADGQCDLVIELTKTSDRNYVYLLSRSTGLHGATSDWARTKVELTRGDAGITTPVSGNSTTPYYDLMGREVTHPTRGIYIKDGRKVMIGY